MRKKRIRKTRTPKSPTSIIGPTPQQLEKNDYDISDTGTASRAITICDKLHRAGDLSDTQLKAINIYEDMHHKIYGTSGSLRSCVDFSVRSGPSCADTEKHIQRSIRFKELSAKLGRNQSTLDKYAIYDGLEIPDWEYCANKGGAVKIPTHIAERDKRPLMDAINTLVVEFVL